MLVTYKKEAQTVRLRLSLRNREFIQWSEGSQYTDRVYPSWDGKNLLLTLSASGNKVTKQTRIREIVLAPQHLGCAIWEFDWQARTTPVFAPIEGASSGRALLLPLYELASQSLLKGPTIDDSVVTAVRVVNAYLQQDLTAEVVVVDRVLRIRRTLVQEIE